MKQPLKFDDNTDKLLKKIVKELTVKNRKKRLEKQLKQKSSFYITKQ